ncbi:MAG: hypothetical protein Q9174_003034 [Haloplaca sp. 1 TL-2023]
MPSHEWRKLLLLCVFGASSLSATVAQKVPDQALANRQTAAEDPLINLQVSNPILLPSGNKSQDGCVHNVVLMEHDFAFSYGKPFVGSVSPPPCNFNRVIMNFTVTSKGRQFDRLGIMYLGDIEVFRTSTAEPTTNGIEWTYFKEMTHYISLFRSEQKIIFDMGNLVDETYTGIFSTRLTATFSTTPSDDYLYAADIILPISRQASRDNAPSAFSLPSDKAVVKHQLPAITERAVVSLSACGQGAEEFWYTNVLNSQVSTFGNEIGTLYGYSPFREVQLLIDGHLAGVAWPFPVIFTGGISPGLWRPIAGIDAFDLREHEIDITPWLPYFLRGGDHSFEIRVVGVDDDGTGKASLSSEVGSSWIVTGKIFIFLGPEYVGPEDTDTSDPSPFPRIDAPPPTLRIDSSKVTTNATGANETLTFHLSVTRYISITSAITTSATSSYPVSWTQKLSYTNLNLLQAQGLDQYTTQATNGEELSIHGEDAATHRYSSAYAYPITVHSTFSTESNGDFGINASVSRGLDLTVNGPSAFPSGTQSFDMGNSSSPPSFYLSGHQQPVPVPSRPLPFLNGSVTRTNQDGTARYLSAGNRSYSLGTLQQEFSFNGLRDVGNKGAELRLYERGIKAVDARVVSNEEVLLGARIGPLSRFGRGDGAMLTQEGGGKSVKELLGRGPGRPISLLIGGDGQVSGGVGVNTA